MEATGISRFEEARASLAQAGTVPFDRDAFLLNGIVGALLRELMPSDAPAPTVNAYGALLHMLYLGWVHGWPLRAVAAEELRASLDEAVTGDPPMGLDVVQPFISYVQLPEQLVWAEPMAGRAHEPLDGVFLMVHDDRVTALAVLGFRTEREGFTTAEASRRLPIPMPEPRADGSAPFTSVLPGGDRAGLISLADETELLALAVLAGAPARR